MRWADVEHVRTFKRDWLTTDEIWLLLTLAGGGAVEVSEEWPGFAVFRAEFERLFSTVPRDLWTRVMKPALSRNEAILFERQPTGTAQDIARKPTGRP